MLDATSPFIGGTVLTGMTCSALTAGVMALGVAVGEPATIAPKTRPFDPSVDETDQPGVRPLVNGVPEEDWPRKTRTLWPIVIYS